MIFTYILYCWRETQARRVQLANINEARCINQGKYHIKFTGVGHSYNIHEMQSNKNTTKYSLKNDHVVLWTAPQNLIVSQRQHCVVDYLWLHRCSCCVHLVHSTWWLYMLIAGGFSWTRPSSLGSGCACKCIPCMFCQLKVAETAMIRGVVIKGISLMEYLFVRKWKYWKLAPGGFGTRWCGCDSLTDL